MANVTAPLVIAKRADGTDAYLYEGATFPEGMAKGELKRLQDAGLVDGGEQDISDDAPPADEKPAGNASGEAWAEYAKAQGKTDAELDGLGRDEIRALFA